MVDTVNRVQASVRLFHLPPSAFLPGSHETRQREWLQWSVRGRLPIYDMLSCSCKTFDLPASISRATEHSTRSISARVRFSVAKTGNKQSPMYTKRRRRRTVVERTERERKRKHPKCVGTYVYMEKKGFYVARVGAGRANFMDFE